MKKYLEKIDYSNPDNKHKMNNLFIELIDSAKENDEEMYKYAKCEVYEIVYGKKISVEKAEEWVKSMEPMAKWTMEDVSGVVSSYGLNIPVSSAYVIMNMLYSDSKNVYGDGDTEESLIKYIEGTKDFYFDEDTNGDGEEKLYNYWKYIVKK